MKSKKKERIGGELFVSLETKVDCVKHVGVDLRVRNILLLLSLLFWLGNDHGSEDVVLEISGQKKFFSDHCTEDSLVFFYTFKERIIIFGFDFEFERRRSLFEELIKSGETHHRDDLEISGESKGQSKGRKVNFFFFFFFLMRFTGQRLSHYKPRCSLCCF